MSSVRQVLRVSLFLSATAVAVYAAGGISPKTMPDITLPYEEVFSNRGEWSPSEAYRGNYAERQGDTVSYGEFNGQKLWWWAKYYASGSHLTPGKAAPDGGESPWVLVNSQSAEQNGSVAYHWRGLNRDMDTITGLQIQIPTWRDGAEAAYTMTHDEMGAMPFDFSVKPGWDLAKEYPDIKQSWGVVTTRMSDYEWEQAIKMALDGHEIYSNGNDMISPVDQYRTFHHGDTLSVYNPSLPESIRGLVTVGLWGDPRVKIGAGEETITFENELIKVTCTPYWTLNAPAQGEPGTFTSLHGNQVEIIEPIIELKPGTEEIITHTGQKLYVKYTTRDSSGNGANEGLISSSEIVWYELGELDEYGQNGWGSSAENVQGDKGAPGFANNVLVTLGSDWASSPEEVEYEVAASLDSINKNVYEKIVEHGEYFPMGKRCEFYTYPFDGYTEETHKILSDLGVVSSRGGELKGRPIPGDFNHPFRIPYDFSYINKKDWDPTKSGEDYLYPNNPYMSMGLNEMVDSLIQSNGYMIRSFHAVADIADGEWFNESERPEQWSINTPGYGEGGWFGGITRNQLKLHYDFLQQRIQNNQLAVYTPSEAVKYRMTANACGTPTITPNGDNYDIEIPVSKTFDSKYMEEISVIVSFETPLEDFNLRYEMISSTMTSKPRRAPRKLNDAGTLWSISINPFYGKVKLISGEPWIDPLSNAIEKSFSVGKARFDGIVNNQLSFSLPQGEYQVELFNLQGRLVKTVNLISSTGVVKTPTLKGLSSGFLLMQVNSKGKAIMPTQKIIIK